MNDVADNDPALLPQMEEAPDPNRWNALIVLLTGAFLPAFDFFVVNVALPAMHSELGARPEDLELVVAGYGLAFAILLITGGRLGDLYGRKRLFIMGMIGFTLASALCGLATSPAMLIASRVLQGLTAALMNPQVLAIIRVTFPENERARAIGYFGTTLGLASIAAQLVGGALVQADLFGLGWRPIFLVNVPVGAVGPVLRRQQLARIQGSGPPDVGFRRHRPGDPDTRVADLPAGRGCRAGAGRGGCWPCRCCPCRRWRRSCSMRPISSSAAARLWSACGYSATRPSPLGLVMAMTFFSGLAAFFMGLTIFLQQGFGYGPLATGLVFVAFGLGFVGASLSSSRISRRIGTRAISLGTGLMGTGLLAIVALANRAHGAAINLYVLWPVLIYYGCGRAWHCPPWSPPWSAAAASHRRRRERPPACSPWCSRSPSRWAWR